jgi:hypothetical protein
MIDQITASYTVDNIDVELTVRTDMAENLPYNLASLFARIIHDTEVNADMVMEQLSNDLETE